MKSCAVFCEKLTSLLAGRTAKIDINSQYFCSAVLLPLTDVDGELSVLFEVRSQQLTWQPGEICFPGGRIEDEDDNPQAAAIRETSEELGIAAENLKMLGALDYVISPIGAVLFPFVGYIPDRAAMHPSQGEVAEVFSVPLGYLLNTKPAEGKMEMATKPLPGFPFELIPANYPRDWKKRTTYTVLFYPYKDYVIWGLTAQVLFSFLKLCRRIV